MRGKIKGPIDVMTAEETDMALLTETKGPPLSLNSCTWFTLERRSGKGRCVAIVIKNNFANLISIY